jgi:hypothetical protein
MNRSIKIKAVRLAGLLLLCLLFMAPAAWGAYEVSNIVPNPTPTGQYIQWTENIVVSWDKPAVSSPDVLNGFIYKWSTSPNPLDDTAFSFATVNTANAGTGEDGFIPATIDMPTVVKDKSTLANLDSDQLLYLHIKTFYVSSAQPTYSADIRTPAFMIDNKAPTGTVTVVNAGGGAITETSNTTVKVLLSASADTTKAYLNEEAALISSIQIDPYATSVDYPFFNPAPGNKTLYAWFQDAAGNITPEQNPAAYSITLLASLYISPNTATIDLATGDTLPFRVEGTEAAYNWTIINQVPATSGTVAQFSGASTGVNAVTVQGLAEGTFQLQAGALTSGTITVSKSTTPKTYDLVTTATTNVNAIVLSRSGTGYTKASDLFAGVPNCNDLSRWNASMQAYESYVPFANDFDLVVGEPYFVSVSVGGPFVLNGSDPAMRYNLITTATTSVNAISLPKTKSNLTLASELFGDIPNCNDLSRWNATMQAYESYVPFANDFAIAVDEAYFVSVSSQTNWP